MNCSTLPEETMGAILLVEDDAKLASLVREYLTQQQFAVTVEPRGDRAAERIVAEQPDLVILDILLPGKDGRTVCREVRSDYDGPIMMLTALADEVDEVVGLELGADDYMAKPVKPRLLLSRIKALLRRAKRSSVPDRPALVAGSEVNGKISIGSLLVDAGNRTVTVAGNEVVLTTSEFDLLHFMASHPGEVLSRGRLYPELLGFDYDGLDRTIDLRITRLRKKLGDDGRDPRLIKSIRGEGYLMVTDP